MRVQIVPNEKSLERVEVQLTISLSYSELKELKDQLMDIKIRECYPGSYLFSGIANAVLDMRNSLIQHGIIEEPREPRT